MITIATINERLSLGLTGKFVEEELGVTATEKEKKSSKWTEEQYSGPIIDKLIAHLERQRRSTVVAAPKPKAKLDAAASEGGGFDMGGEAASTEGTGFDLGSDDAGGFDLGEEKKTPVVPEEFAF